MNAFTSVVFENAKVVPLRTTNPKIFSCWLKHITTEIPRLEHIANHASNKALNRFTRTYFD